MRVIAYHRVSTDKQADAGNGLEAQAATIGKAVTARGEADVLVVAKLDRLSRSVRDFATLVERAGRNGWSLVALDIDVDTSTPTGELMANIYGSVAQWERRIIGQRTSEAMQAMKNRGVRLGRPVELAADVRLRIATERAAGRSLRVIADDLNSQAVPTARGGKWHASTVRAVVESLALDDLARSA
jgi:DNA invertase Pin-like site-specific DNA recombinase